ncbi:GTP cyclohydrolase I [Roseibium alexandrii]
MERKLLIFRVLEQQRMRRPRIDHQFHCSFRQLSGMCITTRGIKKPGVSMLTRKLLGEFQTDVELRRDFLSSISVSNGALA